MTLGAFEFNPDITPKRAQALADACTHFQLIAGIMDETLPAGREKAVVMTKLEEAFMFACKAITHEKRRMSVAVDNIVNITTAVPPGCI